MTGRTQSSTLLGANALPIAIARAAEHCLPGREAASVNIEIRAAQRRLQRMDRRRSYPRRPISPSVV
jgi:hypothetical protein